MDEENSYIRALHQRVPTIATIKTRSNIPFDEDASYIRDESLADNMSCITDSSNDKTATERSDKGGFVVVAPSMEEIVQDVMDIDSAQNSIVDSAGKSFSDNSRTGSRSSRSSKASASIESHGGSQGGYSRSTKGTRGTKDTNTDSTFGNLSVFSGRSEAYTTDYSTQSASIHSAGGSTSARSAHTSETGGNSNSSQLSGSHLSDKEALEAYSKICGSGEGSYYGVPAPSPSRSRSSRSAATSNSVEATSTIRKTSRVASTSTPVVKSARRGGNRRGGAATPTSLGSSSRTTRETQQTLSLSMMSAYVKSFDSVYSAAQTIQGTFTFGAAIDEDIDDKVRLEKEAVEKQQLEKEAIEKQQHQEAERKLLETEQKLLVAEKKLFQAEKKALFVEAEKKMVVYSTEEKLNEHKKEHQVENQVVSVYSSEEKVQGTTMEIKEVASFVLKDEERLEKLQKLSDELQNLALESGRVQQVDLAETAAHKTVEEEEESASMPQPVVESPQEKREGNTTVLLCKRVPTVDPQDVQSVLIDTNDASSDEKHASMQEEKYEEEKLKEEALLEQILEQEEKAPKEDSFKLHKESSSKTQGSLTTIAPLSGGHSSKGRFGFAKLKSKSKSRFFGMKKAGSRNKSRKSLDSKIHVIKEVEDEDKIELDHSSSAKSVKADDEFMMKSVLKADDDVVMKSAIKEDPAKDTASSSNDGDSSPTKLTKDDMLKGLMLPRVQSKCESTNSNGTDGTENVTLDSQEDEAKEEEGGLMLGNGDGAPLDNQAEELVLPEDTTVEAIWTTGANDNRMFGNLFNCNPFQCGGKSFVDASSSDVIELSHMVLYDDDVDEALDVEVFNDRNNITRIGFFDGSVDKSREKPKQVAPEQVPHQVPNQGNGRKVASKADVKAKVDPGIEIVSSKDEDVMIIDSGSNKVNEISHKLEQKQNSSSAFGSTDKSKKNGLRTRFFKSKKGKRVKSSQQKRKQKKNKKKSKDTSTLQDQLEHAQKLEKINAEKLKRAAQAASEAAEAVKAAEASKPARVVVTEKRPEPAVQQEMCGHMCGSLEGLDSGDDLDELFEGLE